MRLPSSILLASFVLLACSSTSNNNSSSGQPGADGGSSSDGGTTVTPGSTTLAPECAEGGAGVTKDGWTLVIGKDFVAGKNGNVTVAIVYSMVIDNQLRSASHFAEGVWDKLLGAEYTAGARTSGGDTFGDLPYSSGPATEIATGAAAFIMVTSARDNGTTFPVIAIAPDEATLKAALPTPQSVSDMRRYNYFPLSCMGIVGTWSTSSLTVVDTNAGLKASSLRFDFSLDASSNYTMNATVTTNTGSQKENDSGTYTSSAQGIALTSTAGFRNASYDAGFVAVKDAVGLYIVDQQFPGDAWLLFRK